MKIRGVKNSITEKPWWIPFLLKFKRKVTALIGPNGVGKSTVMSILSRLIAKDEGV